MSSHSLSAASSKAAQELLVNLEHVSLKAPDEFFIHCSLITKSFAHLYLASAISDSNLWALFLGSSNLTVVEWP